MNNLRGPAEAFALVITAAITVTAMADKLPQTKKPVPVNTESAISYHKTVTDFLRLCERNNIVTT